jgi:arylsulfatase A-like enzyme
VSQFERWLSDMRAPDAPWFAFIQALDAHGPYWPEAPHRELFQDDLPDDLRMTPAGSTYQTYGAIPNWMAWTEVPDAERANAGNWPIPAELPLETIVARYDETIRKTDHHLGELFDLLRAEGLYDDAVIVVTGDHGESFDHGVYSHGVLWEDVLQVPLLIKLPRSEHGGTRVATSVQLVDVYPTLYELVGAGRPRGYLHGRSLLPLMRGEGAPRATFAEGGLIEQAAIEDGGWKLVETRPGHGAGHASLFSHPRVPRAWLEEHVPELAATGILTEELRLELTGPAYADAYEELKELLAGPYLALYDLNSDPGETRNLADERPDQVERLRALLERERRRGREAQADAKPDARPPQLSPEQLEALNDLGYTGEEGG